VNSGEQLCLACGLCCDGSLFDNVRLGPDEDAEKVKTLGLPVKRSRAKRPVAFFRQPCAALGEDCACCVYGDRPAQCRTFECGVFKDAQAGRIGFDAAFRLVKQARRKADKVRLLLRELEDADEKHSLGARFRRTQRRLESEVADESAARVFADLGLAVHKLNLLAHEKFYTEADSS